MTGPLSRDGAESILCLKMSNHMSHSSTGAGAKASIASKATNSAATVVRAIENVASNSILKMGDVRAALAADILDMVGPVEYTIDSAAAATELHFVNDAKNVLVRATQDFRVLLLEGQDFLIKNEDTVAHYVHPHHFDKNGELHNAGMVTAAPGQSVHATH